MDQRTVDCAGFVLLAVAAAVAKTNDQQRLPLALRLSRHM